MILSEAVVERGFSKMKLTLTNKQTQLDNKSVDTDENVSQQLNIGTRSSATNSKHRRDNAKEEYFLKIFSLSRSLFYLTLLFNT